MLIPDKTTVVDNVVQVDHLAKEEPLRKKPTPTNSDNPAVPTERHCLPLMNCAGLNCRGLGTPRLFESLVV
jgi:hypothetical protein